MRKKKFFAVAMVTTLVVSSTMSAFAANVDASIKYNTPMLVDGSKGWNTADGDNYLISEKPVTVKFTNIPFCREGATKVENYDNFIIETVQTATTKGVTLRADAYGWTYPNEASDLSDATIANEHSWGDDWASFQTICKENPNVSVTATKVDENVVTFDIAFGDAATEKYTVTYADGVPSDLYFHIGADGGKVEITEATYPTDKVKLGDATHDVTIGAGFSDNTGDEVLSGDFDVTYSLNNKSNGTNNWDNFIVELRTQEGTGKDGNNVFIDMRADNFGWTANTTDDSKITFAEVNPDWDAWADAMRAGADCTVNVKRAGNTFTITVNAAGETFVGTATVADFEGQDVVMHLTGENVSLTNVKLAATNTPAPTPTPDPEPENPTGSNVTISAEEVEKLNKDAKVNADSLKAAGLDADTNIGVGACLKTDKAYGVATKYVEDNAKDLKWAMLDLKLLDKNNVAVQPKDGKVKVTLPVLTELKDATKIEVLRYDAETGKYVSLGISKVADGVFSFETDHFTPYLFVDASKVVEEETTTVKTEETTTAKADDKTGTETKAETKADAKTDAPKTGDAAPVAALAVLAMAAVAGVFASRKKNA